MKNNYEIHGEVTAIFLRRDNGSIIKTLVDTKELPRLKGFECAWVAKWDHGTNSFRAVTRYTDSYGKRRSVSLSRFITGAPDGLCVDHIDHDTLNNRLSNLRILKISDNNQNRKHLQRNNTSGITGVSWRKKEQKWRAQIQVNYKNIWLGYFDTKEEAAKAVTDAKKKLMPYSQEALCGANSPATGTE